MTYLMLFVDFKALQCLIHEFGHNIVAILFRRIVFPFDVLDQVFQHFDPLFSGCPTSRKVLKINKEINRMIEKESIAMCYLVNLQCNGIGQFFELFEEIVWLYFQFLQHLALGQLGKLNDISHVYALFTQPFTIIIKWQKELCLLRLCEFLYHLNIWIFKLHVFYWQCEC